MSEVLVEWPADLPVPLKSRKHRILSRGIVTQMDSARLRSRRLYTASLELLEVKWNFTVDEFDTFKTFFDETLLNGSLAFTLDEGESDLLELAFLEPYSFTETDNLYSVSATLQIYVQDGESGESGISVESGQSGIPQSGESGQSGQSGAGQSTGIGEESGQPIPDGDPDPDGDWDYTTWLDYYSTTSSWSSLAAINKHAALELMDDFVARILGVTPTDYILYWDLVSSSGFFDKQLEIKAGSGDFTYGSGIGDTPAHTAPAYALWIKYDL